MMERINLLPEEVRLNFLEKLLLVINRQFLKVLAGAVGTVVMLAMVLSLGQGISLLTAKKRVKALKQEIQILQVESQNKEAFYKQLEQVEKELLRQKGLIDLKVAYLNGAAAHPHIWAGVLKDLRRNIPSGVWLTELESGPGGSLRIAGGAADESQVTQFMSNLKNSSQFSNVGFTYTEKDTIGRAWVVKFEVTCRVS